MDYKKIFKKAFSSVIETYPCSDHETVLKNIKEKVENIKKDQKVQRANAKEIYADLSVTNKTTKTTHAVIRTTIAAALLIGTLFGFNYLTKDSGMIDRNINKKNTRIGYQNTDNVNTADNKSDINSSNNEYEKLDVAIPDDLRYEFNGFAVEPRWCFFDGMTVHLSYDIVFNGEMSDKAPVLNVVSNDAEGTVYELNRSDERIVMKSVLLYPYAKKAVNIDFVDPYDGITYTMRIDKPETAPVLSVDTDKIVNLPVNNASKRIKHIEAACSAVAIEIDDISKEKNIAQYFDITLKLKDGTEVKAADSSDQQPNWIERSMNDKYCIRFAVEIFEPLNIEKIYVGDTLVFSN